jgi:hypothetical protein
MHKRFKYEMSHKTFTDVGPSTRYPGPVFYQLINFSKKNLTLTSHIINFGNDI